MLWLVQRSAGQLAGVAVGGCRGGARG